MNYEKASATIKGIVEKTLSGELAEHIIQKTDYGYNVYNKYKLSESDGEWIVESNISLTFSTSKTALAWCIYSNKQDHNAAKNVYQLDYKIASKQIDIDMLLNRIENAEQDHIEISRSRLTHDIDTRRRLRKELAKLVEAAKYIK